MLIVGLVWSVKNCYLFKALACHRKDYWCSVKHETHIQGVRFFDVVRKKIYDPFSRVMKIC